MTENPTIPNTNETTNKANTVDLNGFSLTPKETVNSLNLDNIRKVSTPSQTNNPFGNPGDKKTATIPENGKDPNKVSSEINLSNFKKPIAKTIVEDKGSPALFTSGIENQTETKTIKPAAFIVKMRIIVSLYMLVFVGIIGIVGTQVYKNYISLRNEIQIPEDKKEFVQKGEEFEVFISRTTKINEYINRQNQTSVLLNENKKKTFIEEMKNNTKLNYTQKRNIIQDNITELNSSLIRNNKKLESIKGEITKYGFIPKELYDMTQKGDGVNNIRNMMVLTENIKFMTAFKVFGYLQSFIQGFASDSGIDPLEAEKQIKELNENGEKDVIIYTNNCYLNPYEITDECSVTSDFDNYYTLIDKTDSLTKVNFIKKIASYTERKLEEKYIPLYTITFPSFNAKNQKIEFETEINTSKTDELALNKIGIINPHLYIITNLINALKQSLLIIGEGIKIDQIKILPKTIRIGSTIFNVNTSTLKFSLPIQQTSQREIADFFNNQQSD